MYTVYDRIFGDFPAKITVYKPVLANPKCRRMGGTHTRDTGEIDKIYRSIPASSSSLVFALRGAGN
jgi:hypothetical protein